MIIPDEIFVDKDALSKGVIVASNHEAVDTEGNVTTHKFVDSEIVEDIKAESSEEGEIEGYRRGYVDCEEEINREM